MYNLIIDQRLMMMYEDDPDRKPARGNRPEMDEAAFISKFGRGDVDG